MSPHRAYKETKRVISDTALQKQDGRAQFEASAEDIHNHQTR